MVKGSYEGKTLSDPEIRTLFTRDHLMKSDWYIERLKTKQKLEIALWDRHIDYLKTFLAKISYKEEAQRLQLTERLEEAKANRADVAKPDYLDFLNGTIGVQPLNVFGA
jgi:hypothetical protein